MEVADVGDTAGCVSEPTCRSLCVRVWMENMREDQDTETALALSLGRSFAKQRLEDNLREIAILLAGAVALIYIALQQSYYLVMATQLVLPWLLCVWLARNGPVGVFLAWTCSAIVSYILLMGYLGYASFVNRTTAVATAVIIGATLFAVIAMHRPEMLVKNERPLAVFVYCFVVVYSYTAIFQVNCLLERSPLTIYRPVVLEKVYGFRARGLLVESWSSDELPNAASFLVKRGAAMIPPSRVVC